LCGDPSKGITQEQWDACCQQTADTLKKYLGANVLPYIEPWSSSKKFQMRFDTYIKFQEL